MNIRYKIFNFEGKTYLFNGNNVELVELSTKDSIDEYIPK